VTGWQQWIGAVGDGDAARLWHSLLHQIRDAALDQPAAGIHDHVDPLLDCRGPSSRQEVLGVLFYGSCLLTQTQTASSFPDFYVLVRDLHRFHTSRWHALMNHMLPPNVYLFPTVPDHAQPRCKYCVISIDQFRRETSSAAHDIHHLGRFSKRVALVYHRDEGVVDAVVQGMLQAMLTLVPHTLSRLPRRFTLDQFVLQQLGLSYAGEQRVHEPTKLQALMQGALPYYRRIHTDVLALHGLRFHAPLRQDGGYVQGAIRASHRHRTERFLRRSRRRSMLRWPKYILTVDDWVDYLLDKLQRHHGVKLELTSRQRRHPLLLGWPVYLKMRWRGIVR